MPVVLMLDVEPQHEVYIPDYQIYHNHSTIKYHLQDMASQYSSIIHMNEYNFKSAKGNSQLLTRISNFSFPQSIKVDSRHKHLPSSEPKQEKVRLLLSFGEHAREFFPIESFFHLLKNLTKGLTLQNDPLDEINYSQQFSRWVLSNFDIFVIVMANPDGRLYVEDSKNFCWRGTSSGVDLNRNFDWEFGMKGSSGDPKDEEFRGLYAFSGTP